MADVPPSGISPIRAKASRKLADSVATTRSAARAVEQPTPAATPFDRRDHGLRAAGHGADDPVGGVECAHVEPLVRVLAGDVGARAERRAGPGDDDDPDVVVRRGVLEPLGQGDGQLAAERVEHGGPVEGEPERAAVARLDQEVVSLQQR